SSLLVSSSSSMREYSICAMANGSLPSMSGVLPGVSGFFGGFGSSAPRFIRDADGTRSTSTEPQLGQASSLRCFWEAKSSAEPNQPSKRWPTAQSRSKTIIWHILQCCHDRSEEHTSELQSPCNLVCRLLLEKKKKKYNYINYS